MTKSVQIRILVNDIFFKRTKKHLRTPIIATHTHCSSLSTMPQTPLLPNTILVEGDTHWQSCFTGAFGNIMKGASDQPGAKQSEWAVQC